MVPLYKGMNKRCKKSFMKSSQFRLEQLIEFNDKKICGLKITYSCNNRCVFCSAGLKRDENSHFRFSLSDLKALLPRLKQDGIEALFFLGGEPTLHPDLISMVDLAKQQGFQEIGVGSNGRRFAYERFTRQIIKAGLSNAIISIHAHENELAEKLAGTNHVLPQQMLGLHHLRESGIRILDIVIVIIQSNIEHLSAIWKQVQPFSPDRVTFSLCVPDGYAKIHASEILPKLEDCFQAVLPILQKHGSQPKPQIKLRGFPFCMTSKELWSFFDCYHQDVNLFATPDRYLTPSSIHPEGEVCASCPLSSYCMFPYEKMKSYLSEEMRAVCQSFRYHLL